MRKIFSAGFIVLLIVLLVFGLNLKKKLQSKQNVSPISKIGEAACAKLEYSESKESKLFITSEIKTLSNVFLSLDIVNSDTPVSEWIYRITFNCVELSLDDQEIVVLIGPNAMSINGENYSTPENIPFEIVVNIFASKYEYFADTMPNNQSGNNN